MAASADSREAQRRADQIAAFRAELEALAREGLTPLDAAARTAVEAHHKRLLARLAREFDVDRSAADKRMSAGMRAASLLGAAALVAAVVSFFMRIWGALDAPVQVALVTAAPVLSVALTAAAARLETTRYVASIFAIVACAAFVLQTTLLGSLFNLRGSPHVLGAWAAFCLAVAAPWRLPLPFATGAAALVAWGAALLILPTAAPWTAIGERPETVMLPSLLLLVATRAVPPELAPWGRRVALAGLLGPVLVLSMSGTSSELPFSANAIQVTYQVLAVPLAVAVLATGIRRSLPDVVQAGGVFSALFLLTRFVDWWWDWMPKPLFFLIIAGLAIGWLWALRVVRGRAATA